VHQYRHPAHQEILELPAGVMEIDETPETSAQREIREEIGMRANNIQEIGGFYLAPGYSTEYMYIFLATELSPDALQGDANEFISIEKIRAEKAIQMAKEGKLIDAKSLIAIFWVSLYLFDIC
jgi:ADP-ribose pyrophosphatase